jgi:hypothetical protein
MQMSFASNINNDLAAQREATGKMNLWFTFAKLKASDINIDPLKSWISNYKHCSNMLLNPVIAGAIISNDKSELEPITMPTLG